MYSQTMLGSNYPDSTFSSSKIKATAPALIFFKSQKDQKFLSENNSSLMNRSPMRSPNIKPNSLISRFPLISKTNIKQSDCKYRENAIFNKSTGFQQKFNNSTYHCENHQKRIANYMVVLDDDNFEYYCEKCTILLASQGYKVEKISDSSFFEQNISSGSKNLLKISKISQKSSKSSSQQNIHSLYQSLNSRKFQISNFLSLTKVLLKQIQQKKQGVNENLMKSEQYYGQQIQEVNEYFQLVYKSLQLQKNKCYNYILNQRIQVQKPVRLINDTISQLKQKIQGIIEDIEENIETVYQTTDEIYRPVIEQYEANYQEISKKIQQIQIFQVDLRKVCFQGVPESIFTISDSLKDSIESNYKFEENKQLNNQLYSLKQSLKESVSPIPPKKLFSKKVQSSSNSQSKNTISSNSCNNNQKSNKFCFSFEADTLQAQLESQQIEHSRCQ